MAKKKAIDPPRPPATPPASGGGGSASVEPSSLPPPVSGGASFSRGWVSGGLICILLVALALRLWGIGWGLPNNLHYFSYHPDESHILWASTPATGGLNLFGGKFLPSFYNYGSLQLYLVNIAVSFGSAYGFVGAIVSKSGTIDTNAWAHAFLVARLLTVLMGTATCWVVYAIGARLWGQSAGLLAALLLALMPLAAQHSHFATVDVPATFWITLSLLWSVRAWQDTSKINRAFLLAGVFAGLATATKYNSALVFLPAIVAAFLTPNPPSLFPKRNGEPTVQGSFQEPSGGITTLPPPGAGRVARRAGVGLAGMVIAFVITCPGAILDSHKFVSDFLFEARHVSQQGEIYFQQTGIGWVYIVARNLDAGMGLPLLLLSLAGVVYAIWRRQPGDWLLLAFALPYYLVVGAAQSRYARYEIPLLPILALLAARFLMDFGQIKDPRRPAALAVGGFVALFTLADCVMLLRPMTITDPRDQAAVWLQEHAPPPTEIGFASKPWFWSPAVNPYFSFFGPGQWQSFGPPGQPNRFVYNSAQDYDASLLESAKPSFVTLSEYEYYDWLRLEKPYPVPYVADLDNAVAYIADLKQNYRLVATFSAPHPLGGQREIDGLPIQDLPTDMLYTGPHILVFVRR